MGVPGFDSPAWQLSTSLRMVLISSRFGKCRKVTCAACDSLYKQSRRQIGTDTRGKNPTNAFLTGLKVSHSFFARLEKERSDRFPASDEENVRQSPISFDFAEGAHENPPLIGMVNTAVKGNRK